MNKFLSNNESPGAKFATFPYIAIDAIYMYYFQMQFPHLYANVPKRSSSLPTQYCNLGSVFLR